MPHEESQIANQRDRYVRYPKLTYATIQSGLAKVLVRVGVGRNGWAVMCALCSQVLADGRIGVMSSKRIQEWSGLSEKQVARGMAELREKRIIEPVMRTTYDGFRNKDRPSFRHVAQYRFTKPAWDLIEKNDGRG